MTPDASSDFLAADWGSSNLRAWRLTADGTVLDVRRWPWGVAGLEPREAARKLADEIRPALHAQRLPAILCGMVGSALGIAAAPYADCPADEEALGRSLLKLDDRTWIVPGLRCLRPDGYPDVIRGEETKVLGWLALDPARREGDHVLCLPGTHAKWVLVREGRIAHFITCMTGELFALLSQHSVLRSGAAPSDPSSFAEGLAYGAANGPLASRLFTVRARQVAEGLDPGRAASFLSGLLVGDETARLPPLLGLKPGAILGLMGDPDLCALYRTALEGQGFNIDEIDAEAAVVAGLTQLRHAGAIP
jgi:2-dehydro-3-deoxygalactonokinase